MRSFLWIILLAAVCGFTWDHQSWEEQLIGSYDPISCLSIFPQKPEQMLVGAKDQIIHWDSFGKFPRNLTVSLSGMEKVNAIYIDEGSSQIFYAACDKGLYMSRNAGVSWEKIFQDSDPLVQDCQDVIKLDGNLLVGTRNGLFIMPPGQSNWQKVSGYWEGEAVSAFCAQKPYLYFATPSDVFRLDLTNLQADKIYSSGIPSEIDVEVDDEGIVDLNKQNAIRDLIVSGRNLLAATSQGIFQSLDKGDSWEPVTISGFNPESVRSLALLCGQTEETRNTESSFPDGQEILVAATNEGVFILEFGRWRQIYQGLTTNQINQVQSDGKGRIYAATDQGLFSIQLAGDSHPTTDAGWGFPSLTNSDYEKAAEKFKDEPTIGEVQAMTIAYADVSNEKIDQWKRSSRNSAWWPSVSLGVDQDKNLTRADSVWGTYTGGGQLYIGPDDKTAYNNLGWDVSLTWDLSDLVWSSDLTSIDSRAKLMVELREDLLDQVTRLYFERRRVQMELSASGEGVPPALRFEKQMRIDELTAMIDALTGGQFSQEIKKNNGHLKSAS